MAEITTCDRYRGCLLGLAAGDALGTALEFQMPGTFEPIDDMVGGGLLGLDAGQWMDDTSMALCLAASLLECGEFDALDQMRRYVRWRDDGYMSSTGSCFDIGNTTDAALSRFVSTGEPYAGSRDSRQAGNGSLMRLAPVPMYFAGDAAEAIDRSGESSPMRRLTRADTTAGCLWARCAGRRRRPFLSLATVQWRACGEPARCPQTLRRLRRLRRDHSSTGSHQISGAQATWWRRWRRRCGRFTRHETFARVR